MVPSTLDSFFAMVFCCSFLFLSRRDSSLLLLNDFSPPVVFFSSHLSLSQSKISLNALVQLTSSLLSRVFTSIVVVVVVVVIVSVLFFSLNNI